LKHVYVYISALNPNIHKPQVGKKLSVARSDEDMNGVVLLYVAVSARRSDNANDRLLQTDVTRQ
jgi:hypothetical protein